ncbi:MAG: respiratory nitrate reductase subunit gamma [Gemmatimonadota bacterium]|nr:MAG: respiratory nitrate reductase subunit gamma [Gemmatimonadota bacterium]
MSLILLVTYVSAGVFIVAVVSRFVKYASLPIHLRWELYPVAHEKGRAKYGGSYLEELDWWTKPRESSLIGELKVMIPEILFLAGVREHNKNHWLRSFPFHFGLYLLAGLIVLLIVGAVLEAVGIAVSREAGLAGRAIHHLTYIVGWVGLVLGLLGAIALLVRRVFNASYREYTKKADYFNLAFFIVTFVVAVAAHGMADPYFADLRSYAGSLLMFDFDFSARPLLAAEIVLASILVAYVPLTHMSHFFTKWFMYHGIRWSDEPAQRGGKIEGRVEQLLKHRVTWAAPHIRGDGKKNWVDVATSDVVEDRQQ